MTAFTFNEYKNPAFIFRSKKQGVKQLISAATGSEEESFSASLPSPGLGAACQPRMHMFPQEKDAGLTGRVS
jgi:hypothetical protein